MSDLLGLDKEQGEIMKYSVFAVLIFCCLGAGYQASSSSYVKTGSIQHDPQAQDDLPKSKPVHSWNHFPRI